MFKVLTREELAASKAWAREHYTPLDEIKGVWHPEVQLECVRMNIEHTRYTMPFWLEEQK